MRSRGVSDRAGQERLPARQGDPALPGAPGGPAGRPWAQVQRADARTAGAAARTAGRRRGQVGHPAGPEPQPQAEHGALPGEGLRNRGQGALLQPAGGRLPARSQDGNHVGKGISRY